MLRIITLIYLLSFVVCTLALLAPMDAVAQPERPLNIAEIRYEYYSGGLYDRFYIAKRTLPIQGEGWATNPCWNSEPSYRFLTGPAHAPGPFVYPQVSVISWKEHWGKQKRGCPFEGDTRGIFLRFPGDFRGKYRVQAHWYEQLKINALRFLILLCPLFVRPLSGICPRLYLPNAVLVW